MGTVSGAIMARMHTRRRGKSGSKRPVLQKNPEWVLLDADEIEETVSRLAGQGKSSAEIGLILRDQYAVPNVRLATGKTVTQIMRDRGAKFDVPEDLGDLMAKAVHLKAHLRSHPRDGTNRRALQLLESRIRRLAHYYREQGVLPANWDYSLKIQELAVR